MKRFVLLGAVLTLVAGAAGPAQGALVIAADFQGFSDMGAYGLQTGNPVPISPFPIQAGFIYSDDGTVTTVSVYFGRLGSLPPGPHYDFDTLDYVTLGMPDADRAVFPSNPIDAEFKIGADQTLTLSFSRQEIGFFGFLEREDPSLGFFSSGGVGVAFRLTGTLHLLPDNTVDPSSFSLYGFTGGEFA